MAKQYGAGQLNLTRLVVGTESLPNPNAFNIEVATGATVTPAVSMFRNQSAASSVVYIERFDGLNSTPSRVTYAALQASITTNTAGAHVGQLQMQVAQAGTLTSIVTIDGTSGVTINSALSAGSLVIGSPTGGNKGAGTVNATGLYVNGVLVGSGATIIAAAKGADTTRTSTITETADPDLQFTLTAGTWDFELYLGMTSGIGASGGIRLSFGFGGTYTNNTKMAWQYSGYINGATIATANNLNFTDPFFQASALTVQAGSIGDTLIVKGSIIVSVSGTFYLQWAQNSSNTSGTTIMKGSYLKATLV